LRLPEKLLLKNGRKIAGKSVGTVVILSVIKPATKSKTVKYTNEIIIDLPRASVIELFENPENMKHCQPGFQNMERISGTPGKEGAKSRLEYKMGSREIEMIETITKNNLPDSFDGIYDAKGVHNLMFNRFIPFNENQTQWISETEFEFSGFMKLMGWFMPGMFKKQSQQYLDKFKAFAESQK